MTDKKTTLEERMVEPINKIARALGQAVVDNIGANAHPLDWTTALPTVEFTVRFELRDDGLVAIVESVLK